jgi:hypothetical protein
MRHRIFLFAATLAAATGCSPASSGADTGACLNPQLYNSTFEGYETWTEYAFDGGFIDGSPHTSGPRRVYLKTKPEHGATAFPLGEVIVKEIGPPPASGDSVFAMVKVGCFNDGGAAGWEWAELSVDSTGAPGILWTGAQPPPGMSYSGNPEACNECHGLAKSNDYVQSPELLLSNF